MLTCRTARRAAALLLATALLGCANTDFNAPTMLIRTVDDYTIRTLATTGEPLKVKAGCPINDPEATTQLVSEFPVQVIVSTADNGGVATIVLELTGAEAADPDKLASAGAVVERSGPDALRIVWTAPPDKRREERLVRADIRLSADAAPTSEIGVRARAIDAAGRETILPDPEQPPIGVSTLARACPF